MRSASMQLASNLETSPMMWMMLLHLHVNLNTDDDEHDMGLPESQYSMN